MKINKTGSKENVGRCQQLTGTAFNFCLFAYLLFYILWHLDKTKSQRGSSNCVVFTDLKIPCCVSDDVGTVSACCLPTLKGMGERVFHGERSAAFLSFTHVNPFP